MERNLKIELIDPDTLQEVTTEAIEAHPYLRRLLCPTHKNLYLYNCAHPLCNLFLCGSIDCIDQHFHDNHLSLNKVNLQQMAQKLKRLESMIQKQVRISRQVQKIRRNIDDMIRSNEVVSKNIRKMQEIYQYIVSIQMEPLSLEYLESIETINYLGDMVDKGLNSLWDKIKWNRAWHQLASEQEIVTKLINQFQEFGSLTFQSVTLTFESFPLREDEISSSVRQNEGMVTVVFTAQQFVVGQYIGNVNVDTGSLFLKSFMFVVDPDKRLQKYDIHQPTFIISAKDTHTQSQSHYCLKLKSNLHLSCRIQEENGGLRIVRMANFLCKAR